MTDVDSDQAVTDDALRLLESESSTQYRAWLDRLPASLDESRLAEKLQAIVELYLEELQAIDIRRGYGRD